MNNIAERFDKKNETDPDTPNASCNSSFSSEIHSVVGKGVFFSAKVGVVLSVSSAVIPLGLPVELVNLDRYCSAAFASARAALWDAQAWIPSNHV